MSNSIKLNSYSIFHRFISYGQLGLQKNIQPHQANWVEKTGNAILWTVEDLPKIVYEKLTAPKVITVALTTLGLYVNSLVFYFSKTCTLTKHVFRLLPLPPLWTIRFGSYLFLSLLIIGAGLRAYGRFSNQELMQNFQEPSKA